jgi:hypothetical protein
MRVRPSSRQAPSAPCRVRPPLVGQVDASCSPTMSPSSPPVSRPSQLWVVGPPAATRLRSLLPHPGPQGCLPARRASPQRSASRAHGAGDPGPRPRLRAASVTAPGTCLSPADCSGPRLSSPSPGTVPVGRGGGDVTSVTFPLLPSPAWLLPEAMGRWPAHAFWREGCARPCSGCPWGQDYLEPTGDGASSGGWSQ